MFTSRAEHRLVLRQDNADRRLMKYGYEYGLISKEMYNELKTREILITKSKEILNQTKVTPSQVNQYLESINTATIDNAETLYKLTKRPEVSLISLLENVKNNNDGIGDLLKNQSALEQIEIEIKYDGYIQRQQELISKMDKLEDVLIPLNFNFSNIKSISAEGREKLSKVKPRSIGQASRISGVTPSDISVLLVYLKG
jgi:tRNA uridine 5-carboxymethylaminomethyl modification enzyme